MTRKKGERTEKAGQDGTGHRTQDTRTQTPTERQANKQTNEQISQPQYHNIGNIQGHKLTHTHTGLQDYRSWRAIHIRMPILGPSGVASWNCERGVGSWALDTAKLAVAQDDAGPFIFTCLKILKRTRWVGPSPTGKGPWHLFCICTPGKISKVPKRK